MMGTRTDQGDDRERRAGCFADGYGPPSDPVPRIGDAGRILRQIAKLSGLVDALATGATAPHPLRGRHVALLADVPPGRSPDPLEPIDAAARTLGARTARPVISPSFGPADVAILRNLYDLIYCDRSAAHLAMQIDRQAGLPVLYGLLDTHHATALLGLLLALRTRAGASPPVDLVCVPPEDEANALALVGAAAVLGLAVRLRGPGAAPAPGAWQLVTGPGGYAAWRLQAPRAPALDPAEWGGEVRRLRQLAVQAALLEALA